MCPGYPEHLSTWRDTLAELYDTPRHFMSCAACSRTLRRVWWLSGKTSAASPSDHGVHCEYAARGGMRSHWVMCALESQCTPNRGMVWYALQDIIAAQVASQGHAFLAGSVHTGQASGLWTFDTAFVLKNACHAWSNQYRGRRGCMKASVQQDGYRQSVKLCARPKRRP